MGDYLFLKVEFLEPISVVARNTADILQQCLCNLSAVTRLSSRFGMCTRGVVLDSHGANAAAERAIAQQRGITWRTLRLACVTHHISTAQTKVFGHNTSETISDMINFALAVRDGRVALFREALTQEVQARLVILRGHSTDSDTNIRETLVDMFLTNDRQ
eukprot:4529970-Amphidinium_carterae.1